LYQANQSPALDVFEERKESWSENFGQVELLDFEFLFEEI